MQQPKALRMDLRPSDRSPLQFKMHRTAEQLRALMTIWRVLPQRPAPRLKGVTLACQNAVPHFRSISCAMIR